MQHAEGFAVTISPTHMQEDTAAPSHGTSSAAELTSHL